MTSKPKRYVSKLDASLRRRGLVKTPGKRNPKAKRAWAGALGIYREENE